MKPPKEPKAFKYPRLYCADAHSFAEMIIIYPTTTYAERTFLGNILLRGQFYNSSRIACWSRPNYSPQQNLKAMKEYAKKNGFERIFVGEIR